MEVLLSIQDKIVVKPQYTVYRPKGSVIVARTIQQVHWQWLQMIGEWMHPKFRSRFVGWEYYSVVEPLWKNEFWNWWKTAENDARRTDEMWSLLVTDGEVLAALPKDPFEEVHVTETFPWGRNELKEFLVAPLDVEDDRLDKKGEYERDGKNYSGPFWRFDYEKDFGYGEGKKGEINDPKKEVRPRYHQKKPHNKRIDMRING